MKKNIKRFSKIDTLSKLVREGFNIDTLLKFSDKQLIQLKSKVLNEAETAVVTTLTPQEASDNDGVDIENFTGEVKTTADGGIELRKQQNEGENEEPYLDPRYPEPKTYRDAEGQEREILEDDLEEEIMDMGAGDFDDTSFYNRDAGGFHNSQGPMDSYYSTDNKGTLIGSGTKQNKGQYSGNAKYLDTPSFHNPDAEGFDSDGPMDSYGGNGWDEEGFAGELNEFAPEPKYSFMNHVAKGHQSDGPLGNSGGLYEDSEEDSTNSLEKMSGYDPYAGNTVGNEDGPSRNMKANDGMGMFEGHITKKDLMEKFASKAQARYFHAKANEPGKEGKKWKTYTKEFSDDTKDFDSLPEKVKKEKNEQQIVENWLLRLVEKYERPSMTKSQFLQTLNEIAVETQDIQVIDNDVEDAKDELPAWLDFDSLFSNAPSPTTKPAPTKPGVKPGVKPGRRNPFKPKPGPNPRPKARTKTAPAKPGIKPGIKPGKKNPFKPKPGPNPRPKARTK